MLQAGLRVGEVAALQVADLSLSERSGSVRIRHGKGLKARDVPLNASARRALKQYLTGDLVFSHRYSLTRMHGARGTSAVRLLTNRERAQTARHAR